MIRITKQLLRIPTPAKWIIILLLILCGIGKPGLNAESAPSGIHVFNNSIFDEQTSTCLSSDGTSFLFDSASISNGIWETASSIQLVKLRNFVFTNHVYIADNRPETEIGNGRIMLPIIDSEESFYTSISQKLSLADVNRIKYPFHLSEAMRCWAEKLTKNTSNRWIKSRLLFEELATRPPCGANCQKLLYSTADQVFARWKNTEMLFRCQDYTLLYVTLARSLQIPAYAVNVSELFDGSKSQHVCALVVLGDKGILVDPTLGYFGVQHKRISVLDDTEVTAGLLSEASEMSDIEIACKLAPHLPLVQMNLFEKMIQFYRIEEARKVAKTLTEIDFVSAMGDYANAALAHKLGNLDEAIRLSRKAIAVNPNEIHYQELLARSYAQNGDLSEARQTLLKILKFSEPPQTIDEPVILANNPKRLAAWGLCEQGFRQLAFADYTNAIQSFSKAIDLFPKYADAFLGRGIANSQLGKTSEAIKCYDKVIIYNPNYLAAYMNRASLLLNNGNYIKAVDDCNHAIQLNSQLAESYLIRSIAKKNLGDLKGANADYTIAIKIKPSLEISEPVSR